MKSSFRHWFNQYLKISKKDRNGITVLSILIVLVVVINISVGFIKTNTEYDYSEFEKALEEWEQNQETNHPDFLSLFPFDPNTISEQSLDSLAIPNFIKRNLLSYRNAGGRIKSSDDFRKIYGMNDSIYAVVDDFLIIGTQQNDGRSENYKPNENGLSSIPAESGYFEKKNTNLKIELNSADTTELKKLNGVGSVFALRIVKYRDLLGGFYKKEQLLEVYNFPEETFNLIKNNLEVDLENIRKIRLNFSDFAELLRHPYLSKEQVQSIIDYRDKNGAFRSVSELSEQNILDSVTFIKVEPYLECR